MVIGMGSCPALPAARDETSGPGPEASAEAPSTRIGDVLVLVDELDDLLALRAFADDLLAGDVLEADVD